MFTCDPPFTRQYPTPIPVRPSPLVGALASSSHDPNCRNDTDAGVDGTEPPSTAPNAATAVVSVVVFGDLGRPRPWAAASCEPAKSAATIAALSGRRCGLTLRLRRM